MVVSYHITLRAASRAFRSVRKILSLSLSGFRDEVSGFRNEEWGGTPSGARAAGDVGPYHAHMLPARSTHPMVGRDVPGAPRTRERPRGHRPRPSKADGSAEEEVRAAPLNAFVPIDVTTVFELSPTASRRAKDPRRPRRVASNKSFTPNGKSEHGRGPAPG